MASFQEIQNEITALGRPDQFDIVRHAKLGRLAEVVGREVLLYGVDFPGSNPIKSQMTAGLTQISLTDKDGVDEVTRNLSGPHLDVIIHSPGGSAEATESIVEIIRSRFTGEVRFIIPNVAKSAATMLTMSGNQIIIDERSELGPTDPQMVFAGDRQSIIAPAQAIKDQFEAAQKDINGDPRRLPGWVPLLQQLGPSLLSECDNHIALAKDLVEKWLRTYMFAGDDDGPRKAEEIAEYLSNHNNFLSHGRRVGIADLQSRGVNVLDMREVPVLREAVTDVYTAMMLTFSGTGAFKLFENSNGEVHASQITIETQVEQGASPVPQQQDLRAPSRKSGKQDRRSRGQRQR